MYSIEQTHYGVKLVFSDFIGPEEMTRYKADFRKALDSLPNQFGLMSDMRSLKPLPQESQDILSANPEWTANRIVRSATIIDSMLIKMQARRLATEWKQNESKRLVDASKHANWEEIAIAWIADGKEP